MGLNVLDGDARSAKIEREKGSDNTRKDRLILPSGIKGKCFQISSAAFAKLYTAKVPVTEADTLNDRVLSFFVSQEVDILMILTDRSIVSPLEGLFKQLLMFLSKHEFNSQSGTYWRIEPHFFLEPGIRNIISRQIPRIIQQFFLSHFYHISRSYLPYPLCCIHIE